MCASGEKTLRSILICFLTCFSSAMCTLHTKYSSDSDPKLFMVDRGDLFQIGRLDSLQNVSARLSLSAPIHFRDRVCVRDEDCYDPNEVCVQHSCVCQEFFEYNWNGQCVPCPGQGMRCEGCCSHISLYCYHRVCKCIDESCQEPKGVFVTASQVALCAALIMGLAALAMVVYRLCTRPRYLTARQRTAERSAESVTWGQTSFLRASLTSMQIRVLSRLRDRPPAYEGQTRPTQEMTPAPEAPPPYVECRISGIHQPPPYSEIILTPGEFVNNAYEATENVVAPNEPSGDAVPKIVVIASSTK